MTTPDPAARRDARSASRESTPGLLRDIRVLQELRFALRSLRTASGVMAVVTLSVGLAVTTAVFSLAWQAVLRPLPFPDPQRLAWLRGTEELTVTAQQLHVLEPELASTARLTALARRAFVLEGANEPAEVNGLAVSANHFAIFGVPPYLGRSLTDEDTRPGAERVVYLGYELWRSRFGADSGVIGRSVALFTSAAIPMVAGAFSGDRHVVVGVLPRGYRPFGEEIDVLTPLVLDASDDAYRNLAELQLVGRLTPGAHIGDANRALQRAVSEHPELASLEESVAGRAVVPLTDALVGALRPSMLAALGAAALILLISCANVAALLVLRIRRRSREFAVRRALGASQRHMIRQLMVESAALVIVSAALGTFLAWTLQRTIPSVLPSGVLGGEVSMLGVPLLVTLGVLVVVALACGAIPLLGLGRDAEGAALNRRGVGEGVLARRVTNGLVVAEIALAVVVTNAAFVIGISLARQNAAQLGFETHDVMTVRVAPADPRYRDTDARRAVVEGILEQVRAMPGVEQAGAIHFLPIADGGPMIGFRAAPSDGSDPLIASYRVVTPQYLETMRIPVLAGRTLTRDDDAGSAPVGWVNASMARRLWPGESALGKTLYRANGSLFFTVAGVVGDVRQQALSIAPLPEIYLPLSQTQWASAMTIVVRGSTPSAILTRRMREIVRSVDATLPITRVASMEALVRDSVARDRMLAIVFGAFAALALALSALGVFTVAAAAVTGRRREIGVRIAIGASLRGIARAELWRSGRLALLGVAGGVVGSIAVARLVAALLHDVSPLEPAALLRVAAVILSVVALAAAVPTWRSVQIDPTEALRRDE